MTNTLWLPTTTEVVIGIDEAGRGCWAGPVVAGAVLFKRAYLEKCLRAKNLGDLAKLNDSKKLNHQQRADLVEPIRAVSYWGIGEASHVEIDEINILQATFVAMRRALEALMAKIKVEDPSLWQMYCSETATHHPKVVVDGKLIPPLGKPEWTCEAIIKGDGSCAPIAAASILAKEYRDDLLVQLDGVYPGYGFAQHKSYGTPVHRQALAKLGPSPIHRRSFKPIKDMVKR